jgi:hypothetical protein
MKHLRRPFRLASLAVAVALGTALMTAAPASAVTPVQAAACTDGGYTDGDYTFYNVRVELRVSGGCGGVAWFRLTAVGSLTGNGKITVQTQDQFGNINNGATAALSAAPYVSSYLTGRYARIVFVNSAGAQPNFTGPWKAIPINAFQ